MDLLNSFHVYAYVCAIVLHRMEKDNELVTQEVKDSFIQRICDSSCLAFIEGKPVHETVDFSSLRAHVEILSELKFQYLRTFIE